MNIFLIGYRCTGKTSVGRLLAATLQWPFVDTDQAIVGEQGRSIKAIVSDEGWDRFRLLEKKMLSAVCGNRMQVVATGGGIVLDPANVALMKQHGTVVWLKANVETIYNRMLKDVATDQNRPALTRKKLRREIEDTLDERESLYIGAGDIEIETDDVAPDVLSARLLELINLKSK
jgi:shikimate kinase